MLDNDMKAYYAAITGWGASLPSSIFTNAYLQQTLSTSDEWIFSRTGIKQRYIADSHETVLSLSLAAAQRAIVQADIQTQAIDAIICATTTHEQKMPSLACSLQAELNCPIGVAFDINAACSGFVYALAQAELMLVSGQSQCILVVATDLMSRAVNWQDRTTCILFGDGAGAVLLQRSTTPGIIATELKADGNGRDALYWNVDTTNQSYLTMQGKDVFRMAIEKVPEIILSLLKKSKWSLADVDWIVPHQANQRIIAKIAELLNVPLEKMVSTIDIHANTSAASIPLALVEFALKKKINPGDKVLLIGFGAGFTWGGISLVWS